MNTEFLISITGTHVVITTDSGEVKLAIPDRVEAKAPQVVAKAKEPVAKAKKAVKKRGKRGCAVPTGVRLPVADVFRNSPKHFQVRKLGFKSIADLSRKIGYSQTHVHGVLSGKKLPSMKFVQALADAIGVEPKELIK